MNCELLHLDDQRCTDPGLAGAKAAWLARGRQAGLPVLPGVVVTTEASRAHMERGADALARRGSGGARLEVSQAELPIELVTALRDATGRLGEPLVVRSSSSLEGAGEWSGAFTSYLEVRRGEVAAAVAGCWASAFAVATLDRYGAAGLAAGSVPMAVLIQPALDPGFGGTARLEGDDALVVGVAGSPAPLVQGWEPGFQARVSPDGVVRGEEAIDRLGDVLIGDVGAQLREARRRVGATTCEWASVDGEVILLQLGRVPEADRESRIALPPGLAADSALLLARLVRRYPGPTGEAVVLPWAVADPASWLGPVGPVDVDPTEAMRSAMEHSSRLTAEVWSLPRAAAAAQAARVLRALRGTDPRAALDSLARARPPDGERGRLVLGLLAAAHQGLMEVGALSPRDSGWHLDPADAVGMLGATEPPARRTRIGFDRWEPFDAAAVVATGVRVAGVPAAPGIGSGRLCYVADPARADHFRSRDVVVSSHPVPGLAALLWDAAGVVTTGGGPAAHLFESARALAIPAVCGVHLSETVGSDLGRASGRFALAVDGTEGSVYVTAW